MKKRTIALIGAGIVAAGAIAVYTLGLGSEPMLNLTAVESVRKETITETVSAKGEVSLLNTELIYATTAAEVDEVLVEKNDMVKKGDVLIRYTEKSRETLENKVRDAELSLRSAQLTLSAAMIPASDTTVESARLSISASQQEIENLQAAMNTQLNDIEKAKKDVEDAEKTLDDSKALFEAGAISKEALDQAAKAVTTAEDIVFNLQTAYDKNERALSAAEETHRYRTSVYEETIEKNSTPDAKNIIAQRQVSVEQAQIRLDDARKELSEYQPEIISPIDGTVSMLNISKGSITSTERALMEISNVEDYVVKVDVNERNAAKIALNQNVEVTGAVLGKGIVYGNVTKIGSIAEQKQTSNGVERVVPVEITVIPSAESKVLKPGFSLEAKIITQVKEDIVVAPILSTLKDKDGNTYVYVVKEDNTLEKRIIELGLYADMSAEATNLSEGELIVSQPSLSMTDGMVITPDTGENEAPAEGGMGQ